MTQFCVGQAVTVKPRGFVIFSLREYIRKHGFLSGTVVEIHDPAPFPDAPYVVQLNEEPGRRRWCRPDELEDCR